MGGWEEHTKSLNSYLPMCVQGMNYKNSGPTEICMFNLASELGARARILERVEQICLGRISAWVQIFFLRLKGAFE